MFTMQQASLKGIRFTLYIPVLQVNCSLNMVDRDTLRLHKSSEVTHKEAVALYPDLYGMKIHS